MVSKALRIGLMRRRGGGAVSTPDTIVSVVAGTQTNGTLPVTVNVIGTGTVNWELREDGAGAVQSGTFNITTDPQVFNVALNSGYNDPVGYTFYVENISNTSNAESSIFQLDTKAAVIDTPATANVTSSGFDVTFNCDTAGDTAYMVALPSGATAPSETQIIAGTDGDDNAAAEAQNGATSSGSNSLSFSALSANTAYDYYVTTNDAQGNKASKISGSQTTAEAATGIGGDTNPILWLDNTSWVLNGSNEVTAWNDLSPGGHDFGLGAGSNAPITLKADTPFDAVIFAFNKSLITSGNGPFISTLAGGGSLALFIVVEMDGNVNTLGQDPANLLREGEESTQDNSFLLKGFTQSASNNRYAVRLRGAGADVGEAFTNVGPTLGKQLVHAVCTQSAFRVYVNNSQVAEDVTLTWANAPTSKRMSIGSGYIFATDTSIARTNCPIYEIYATSDTDPANVTNIYNALVAKHGL